MEYGPANDQTRKWGGGGESLECKRKSLYNRRYSNKYIRGTRSINNIVFRIFHISSSVSVIHRESRAFWQINNVFVSIYRLREREIEREIDNEVTMIQRGAWTLLCVTETAVGAARSLHSCASLNLTVIMIFTVYILIYYHINYTHDKHRIWKMICLFIRQVTVLFLQFFFFYVYLCNIRITRPISSVIELHVRLA